MRILHVTDRYLPSVGGIEMIVDRLSTQQRAIGHTTRVLTWTRGPVLEGVVRDAGRLAELLAWADAVHVHLSILSPLAFHALSAAVAARRPVVASVHSMWTHVERPMRLAGKVVGWGRLPVQWAPVSTIAADALHRTLGPGAAVEVLPNAVETSWWRLERPMGERPVHIVWVGRLAARKRVGAAVEVLARTRRLVGDEVPLQATFIGDGPRRREMELRIARHHLEDVATPGSMTPEALRELYASADVFLSTCVLESFGVAALEARTAGLVVVGRQGTGTADFITSGVDGLLAADDSDLATQLAALVTDRARLAAMVAHNLATPPDHDWTHMLARADELYLRAGALQGLDLSRAEGGIR